VSQIEHAAGRAEARLALLNAMKLGASLLVTWSVALGMRFLLPRYLGPEQFGVYSFGESLALTFFVLATLGIETYVQKEIPLRPAHATDFFAGIFSLRLVLAAVLIGAIVGLLQLGGRSHEVQWIAALFGVGQLFFVTNATLAALLHARATVDGLAWTNVFAKLGWAALTVLALSGGLGLPGAAAAFAVTEAARTVALWVQCRMHLRLRLRLSFGAVLEVLRRSLPFFLTTFASTLYSRIDLSLVAFLTGDAEAGWYGLSSSLAQLGLLFTPLIAWVLLPLFARARARSTEELQTLVERALQLIVALATPVSLFLSLGAPEWIGLVGGEAFLPAAASLRLLGPVFAFTYVAMLAASCLNLLNQPWVVTRSCLGGLILNPLIILALVHPFAQWIGPGGAGAAAAFAALATEIVVTALMLQKLGSRILTPRTTRMMGTTVVICAVVALADLGLRGLGPSRLVLDAALYVLLALLTGALDAKTIWAFGLEAWANRRSS
jgi:O-antigen/teichoic acid export membrane protein